MPYTDRVDYVCAIPANHAWALVVEKLGGLGAMAMDIGAITPCTYILREREYVNELLEMICGARLTYNYRRIGGVGWDMPLYFEPSPDEEPLAVSRLEATILALLLAPTVALGAVWQPLARFVDVSLRQW